LTQGQGLNNALEDAAKLVDELSAAASGQYTLTEALRRYEKDMRSRMDTEIPISVAQAQMVHSFDTLMEAPFFKHGMNKYRADREAAGLEIEGATQPKLQ
jgi:2-polyprenyl-6-methoxyphenol hydroxylase-like FAD-dependent oxidoreductase